MSTPRITECPSCHGYGVDERRSTARKRVNCERCGGSGDLFDGQKFSDYQAAKARQENPNA